MHGDHPLRGFDAETTHEDGSRTIYRDGFALYVPPPAAWPRDPRAQLKAALSYIRRRLPATW